MYFRKICYVYILNIFISNINYINIDVNTCKYFQNIHCMCVYLYINNTYTHIYIYIYIIYIYTEHTHILCKQKLLLCVRLIVINGLKVLKYIYIYIYIY